MTSVSVALRPNTAGSYIWLAHRLGYENVPGTDAETRYEYEWFPAGR